MTLTLEYISKLGRVKRVSCIMMQDRGYKITEQEECLKEMSDISVGAKYLCEAKLAKTSLGIALSCTYARGHELTLLLFLDNNYDEGKKREKMVSTEQAKAAILLWKTEFSSCSKCILVCPGKLSPDAKKEVTIPNLTLLTHEFLLLPVGRHCMVPKHEALNEVDSNVFLRERKLSREQLPILRQSDPICMYYGFLPGTIVKISRPGWTVFRVVT